VATTSTIFSIGRRRNELELAPALLYGLRLVTYSSKIALLGNLIDYAGTFPPASLPLEQAISEAAKVRRNLKHPWLLGKMALSLEDLKKISARLLMSSGSDGSPWLFTALGSPLKEETDATEFTRTLEWDLREVRRCNDRGWNSSCRHRVIAYDTKLPGSVPQRGTDAVTDYLSPALERVQALAETDLAIFLEVDLTGPNAGGVLGVGDALARWASAQSEARIVPGIKVRTGGKVTPSAEALATAIVAATSQGLKFKATQGLHHAVTTNNEYGFVNVFAALTLAQALGEESFGVEEIGKCLNEKSAKAFSFGNLKFSWTRHELDLESVEAARRHHAGCFGSCSLTEPDDSLAETFPERVE
jgi:hypothetical protein